MSCVDLPALTPRRKRAVSIRVIDSPALPVTPVQLPDLAWDDTPQPQDSSPSTPPSPHERASHKIPFNTDAANIGTLKQCRSLSQRRTHEASQLEDHTPTKSHLCEIGCKIHTPSILFQPLPIPIPTRQECELELNQINCNFSRLRISSQKSASECPLGYASGEPLDPIFPGSLKAQQDPRRKKAKEDAWTLSVEIEHEARTAPIPASKTSENEEAACKRFSRILPFNTTDRLIEDSGRCVASVLKEPGRRCLRRVKSSVDAKDWLLNKLSTFEVPLDFGDAQSYILELTNLATCTTSGLKSHRSIATKQLERLLDCYDDRSCTASEHNFSKIDIDFMPVWLKALTTDSTKSAKGSTPLNLHANTSPEDAKSPATSGLRPDSSSISIEVGQTAESTHSAETSQSSAVNVDSETTHTTAEVTQTSELIATTDSNQTREIKQFSEATRTIIATIRTTTSIDAADRGQATETTQSRKVNQALEVTQSTGNSQTIKKSQAIEATQTKICVTRNHDTAQSTEVIEKTEGTEITESTQTIEAVDNAATSSQPIENSAAASASIKRTGSTKITLTAEVSQTTETFRTSERVKNTHKIEIVQTADQIQRTKAAQSTESTQFIKSFVGSASIESTRASDGAQTTDSLRTSSRIRIIKENEKIRAEQKFDADMVIGKINFVDASSRTETFRNAVKRAREAKAQSLSPWHQGYQRFYPKASKNVSVQQWLQMSLKRALVPREIKKEGLIYMYWHPGKFGFVKIGMTTKTTGERLRQWERQCGGEVEQHVDGEVTTAIRLPHVFRVEALVHAELKDFRVKEVKCEGCGKGHQEWFDVSPEHAKKVIEKWSVWMKTGVRYKPAGEQWQLDEMVTGDEIQKLCRPVEEKAAARPPVSRRASDMEKKAQRPRARRVRNSVV